VSTDESRRTPPQAPWTRFEPTRSFSAEGVFWRVFEVSYEFDRRRGRSLVFEHEFAWRRVRTYPANWYELPEEQLLTLLSAT
jgi:hypothetical protein